MKLIYEEISYKNFGKCLKISNDFLVIARIESFILGKRLEDAIKRAEAYSRAGADAILIHSKDKDPKKIFSFAKKFSKSRLLPLKFEDIHSNPNKNVKKICKFINAPFGKKYFQIKNFKKKNISNI